MYRDLKRIRLWSAELARAIPRQRRTETFPERRGTAVSTLLIVAIFYASFFDSLNVTTFETALKLYDTLVESTRHASKENRLLAIKIFLEQERFDLYGQYVGILRDRDASLLQQQPAKSQERVRIVTEEVTTLLSDSKTLLQKDGISQSEGDGSQTTSLQPYELSQLRITSGYAPDRDSFRHSQNDSTLPRSRLKCSQRVRWVWKDSKKVFELHQHLRDLNDALWTTLYPHHSSNLQKAIPSFRLPGMNDIASLAEIRSNVTADGGPRIVADCAEMRRTMMLSRQEREGSEAWRQITIPKSHVQPTKKYAGEGIHRSEGLFRSATGSEQVIIEYKTIRQSLTDEEKLIAKTRIRQLAFQLLHARDPYVCLFQCLGLIEDSLTPLRYGIVLKMADTPISGIVSLETLLSDSRTLHQSALGDRFALALSLCYAGLQWHASGWLHKDIHTENIVFLNNRSGPPAISAPKLLGFGSSRPDELSEESLMTLPGEMRASPFCIDHWLEEKRRPKAGVKHRSLSWPNVKLFLACRRYPRSS
ncbi:hypothetical protein MMC22_010591 [Lobaria immixta]|nr:hypothetical protein [Lobaria immixta]